MKDDQDQSLPVPDAASAAHSNAVKDHLVAMIQSAGGSISFAEFMHAVLYAPGLGYYSAGATKFGEAGDFTTAPEVSSVFGRVLAGQCADVMTNIASPSILEFGAGSGKLAADILQKLAQIDALPERYEILEVSADLVERQRSYLAEQVPDFFERVSWLDKLPQEFCGVVIANEVLDALPVERFARRGSRITQLAVAVERDQFVLTEREPPDVLLAAVADVERDLGQQLPDAYVSEICLAAPTWIADLAAILSEGVAFLFDYGVSRREYYAADRSDGWLRCHFRHHAHNNPLILPGIQDITCWVDFSSVAAAATAHGLEIEGFVTQAHFLLNGGLEKELADFDKLPHVAQMQLSGQVKVLTLPGEMGENFKCLGLSRGTHGVITSLAMADRTHSL
ncbi:MAG: class I SAM-dependent methyltransferase [Woeseiaceae bacterium]